MTRPLPIGIENFRELIEKGYYYTDKTLMIKELLDSRAKVNLFARPRRFGKTLNMSMLRYFFEKSGEDNSKLFDGLNISRAGEKYSSQMGQYPVISISLKSMEKLNFADSIGKFKIIISDEFRRHIGLLNNGSLDETERTAFNRIYTQSADVHECEDSLKILSDLMYKEYGRKVIILIDEYDVPLQNAWLHGFYDEMVSFIRSLFGTALKTNDSLEFGVLTGCLRISKESIFTGLNNPKVYSVSDRAFSQCFGFTDAEVKQMLDSYGLNSHYDSLKEWYDGYRFGKTEIYCPWDVINRCSDLLNDPDSPPKAYWINTSGNDVVRRFISSASATVKSDIELLMSGGAVRKTIDQELTYRDMTENNENIWSLLYMTGYLTHKKIIAYDEMELVIPNFEIRKIFEKQIYEWFNDYARQNRGDLTEFCMCFPERDTAKAEKLFTQYLRKVISIRDNNVPTAKKENFYHGILLGLFSHMDDWIVRSNIESGDGYSDILLSLPMEEIGIIIEVKFGEDKDMEKGADEALAQIEHMNYDEALIDNGMTTILKYGIACYKKRCKIKLKE